MFKFPLMRALVLLAGLFMALVLPAGQANAQSDWPNKPVRIVVPFAPGGSTGVLAQLLAARLAEVWGQQVVVDPRGGGNTVIGTEHVAKSAPDGYTLMLTSNSHVVIPQLITTAFDPIKDFAPIATVSSTELVLTLNPAVPAQTLSEFIALAKAKPGQINYASAGTSSATHLAGEMLATLAGIKIQHVPYKGSGPAIADLLGGQVQMSFQTPIVAIPYIQTHKLKALAVSGKTRLSALPEVPTFDEAGLPGFNATTWFGIVAPAGVPQPVIDKVSQDIRKVVTTPAFRTRLSDLGMDPMQTTPAQFADLMKTTRALTAKLIKASNIKLE
jgi:tripartite-type tricarboxylate transporter receptor subunit TctC